MNYAPASVPRSLGLLVVAALSASVTVLFAIRMPAAMTSFREMFAAFGVNPPGAAKLVMAFAPYWWLLAIASVVVLFWVARSGQIPVAEYRRMKLTLRILIAVTVLAYGFAAYALYVPIFKLGAVV
jgi:hypothetical protein